MSSTENREFDLAVIGGGPAALSAAIYSRRKELSTAIITKELGGQLLLTGEVENYPGFPSIGGYKLMKKFKNHAGKYEPDIFEGVTVTKIGQGEDSFTIHSSSESIFKSRTIVIASGKRPRKLDVPGEERLTGKGVSYCTTCDAPLFADRKVAVVGGGDAAFEGIIDLLPLAQKTININRSEPRAEPILQKRVQQEDVESYYNHQVVEILGDGKVEGIKIKEQDSGKTSTLEVDGIFVEIGLIPNSEFATDLVQTNERGEIVVDCKCYTSEEGVFAAGDVTTVPEKQIIISAGEGAKAALGAYRYLIRQ